MVGRGQRIWDRQRDLRLEENVSPWRARLQYKAYRATEGQPVPQRRAYAFETMMRELPIWEALTMYRLLSAEDFVGDAEKVTP